MAGFGSMFGGMKTPAAGQPGSPSFVGPMPKTPWWETGMQQLGAYQQQGGSGIPVISPIMEGMQKHDQLKSQGQLLRTQMQLKQRSSRATQRKTTGTQAAMTGASGLRQEGSTLDLINQTNLEFELDQAITKHSYNLQRDALDKAGDKARISGFMKGGMDIGKMFMGGF